MKPILIAFFLLPILGLSQNITDARKLFEEKKYSEAKKLCEAIKDSQGSYADAQYYLGRIAYQEEKVDAAIEYLEEAIDTNDKVADYHFWLGNAYGSAAQDANAIKQGMLASKIKSEFEKTVELDPKNVNAYQGLIQFYTQAPGFMGGSFEKAHVCADKIKVINLANGCRAKANIYVAEKKFSDAEKEFKNAVKADENYLPVLINFYTNQKSYLNAFALLDDALKKNPDNMANVYQFGKTSALSGQRLEQGESYLKKYLTYKPKDNEPSHAGANMRLAQIFEKKGNKAEAKKLYQTALQLDSKLKEAQEGLDRVK